MEGEKEVMEATTSGRKEAMGAMGATTIGTRGQCQTTSLEEAKEATTMVTCQQNLSKGP